MATVKDEKEKADQDDDADSHSSHNSHHSLNSESEGLSNSDDEKISQLSLNVGLNPCKCCVCEDCDLRQMCIFLGYVEAFVWYFLIAAVLIFGLLSWGSDPAIQTPPDPRPRAFRKHSSAYGYSARNKYDYIKHITLRPITGQNFFHLQRSNSTRSSPKEQGPYPKPYSTWVKKILGSADILLRFSSSMTEAEEIIWERYLQRYLVVMIGLLTLITIMSTVSGFLMIRGAKNVKNHYLWFHTGLATCTGGLIIVLSVILILCKCYVQGVFCIFIALIYVYLAFCSFGLITRNSKGVYGEFRLKGVIYAYAPTFKTKIAPIKPKRKTHFKEPALPPPNLPPEQIEKTSNV